MDPNVLKNLKQLSENNNDYDKMFDVLFASHPLIKSISEIKQKVGFKNLQQKENIGKLDGFKEVAKVYFKILFNILNKENVNLLEDVILDVLTSLLINFDNPQTGKQILEKLSEEIIKKSSQIAPNKTTKMRQ